MGRFTYDMAEAFLHLKSDQAEHQSDDDPEDSHPFGHLGQLGVQALGLVLGQEGVRAAGDGAGQAGALARLEHDHRDDRQTAQDLDNGEDQSQRIHISRSFQGPGGRKFTSSAGKTRKYPKAYHNPNQIASGFRKFQEFSART